MCRKLNTAVTSSALSNFCSCSSDLCRLNGIHSRVVDHRTRSRHQLLAQCLRRWYHDLPDMLHDDQNLDLFFPGRARVHCTWISESAAEDEIVAIQLPVHDVAVHGVRSHELRLAHYVHQR